MRKRTQSAAAAPSERSAASPAGRATMAAGRATMAAGRATMAAGRATMAAGRAAMTAGPAATMAMRPAFSSGAAVALAALAVLLLTATSPASAQIPRTVGHQGLLLLPGVGPAPDGDYIMTFRIYNVESGGTALWAETQTLGVAGGVYNATLGSMTTLNLPFDVQYWLGVQLSGESEMTPRVRLTSVPYAYRAVVAEGLAGGTAGDITAVYANDGLTGGASSGDAPMSVGAGMGIQVSTDAVSLAPSYADGSAHDARFVNEGQGNSVTAGMIVPDLVGAIDGVQNDAGNIDLIAGPNITITPDDANNQITISASGGGGGIGGSGTTNYLSRFTGATTIGNSLLYDTGSRIGVGTTSPTSRFTIAAPSDDGLEVVSAEQPSVLLNSTSPSWGGRIEFHRNGAPKVVLTESADGLFLSRSESTGGFEFESSAVSYLTSGVVSARYVGTAIADYAGIYGQCAQYDDWGYGGLFKGGYVGAKGSVEPTGSFTYYGLQGTANSNSGIGNNIGVYAEASGGSWNAAVQGSAWAGGGTRYAGYFDGNVQVNGNHTVTGTKSFRIDHPLDPANRYLNHFAVESDEVLNAYSGNVTLDGSGEAWVTLADWFDEINRDPRYQLTCVGGQAPVYIAEKITGNRFKIAGGTPGLEVSWQVTAVRNDPTLRKLAPPVEQEKPAPERGKYLDPESFGMPANLQIGLPEKKQTGR